MSDRSDVREGNLLVVLSNPPTTSGVRTLRRVELARQTLGFESVSIANLFSIATYRTSGISIEGIDSHGWLDARPPLQTGVTNSEAVILAYGCQEPTGAARLHFREQLAWLESTIQERGIPTWMVAGRPRHPSRWHRHTFAVFPNLEFEEALPLVLLPI